MKLAYSHVSKNYWKNDALKDVNVSFETGHIYGLLGRNGAGKSTLMKIAAERVIQDEGNVSIDGKSIRGDSRMQALLHLVNDEDYLNDDMRISKLLTSFASICPSFSIVEADRLSKEFGLDGKKKQKALSSGFRMILKDVVALSTKVSFLLLDEPLEGLDAVARDNFYAEIPAYMERSDESAVIISTHLIEEVSPLIDRFVIMDKGSILLMDDMDALATEYHLVKGRTEDMAKMEETGKKIASRTRLGITSMILKGDITVNGNLEETRPSLQELFIELVGGETK